MTPATLDRKVRSIQSEGRAQAKYWLSRADIGPQSVQMALAVLISTQVRSDTLRGVPLQLASTFVRAEELRGRPVEFTR